MRSLHEALWQSTSHADDPEPLEATVCAPGLADVLCLEALRGNTDVSRWERAEWLVTTGAVSNVRATEAGLTGRVQGTRAYTATLEADYPGIKSTCTCPCAESDSPNKILRFCKHSAALGLVALGWGAVPALPPEADYNLGDLDADALRAVLTNTLLGGGSAPAARRALRAAKVRAGTMSVVDALAGEYNDFGVGVKQGTKIWVDVADLAEAINEAHLAPLARATGLLDVLVGIGNLTLQGSRDDGGDTAQCVELLAAYPEQLSAEELYQLGRHSAERLLFWDDTWGSECGWVGDGLTEESQTLLTLLGEQGRRGLGSALEEVLASPAPVRPRAAQAVGTWEQACGELGARKERAATLLGVLTASAR